jgi:hypothetical protein
MACEGIIDGMNYRVTVSGDVTTQRQIVRCVICTKHRMGWGGVGDHDSQLVQQALLVWERESTALGHSV